MPDREKVINQLDVDIQRAERTGEMLVYVGRKTAQEAVAMLKEQDETIKELRNAYGYLQKQFFEAQDKLLKEQEAVVRCKDCKHGSLYCIEDVCGETLIECNRPDLGDVIEIHGWKWFCADGERKSADEILMEKMDADPLG